MCARGVSVKKISTLNSFDREPYRLLRPLSDGTGLEDLTRATTYRFPHQTRCAFQTWDGKIFCDFFILSANVTGIFLTDLTDVYRIEASEFAAFEIGTASR